MAVLICVIALGPSVPGGSSPAGMLNLDVIFVVDTTLSMAAEDFDGESQRLEAAKKDITQLSEKMVGARFSIITFDTEVETVLPMTTDRAALETVVSSLKAELAFASRGSSIDKPIDETVKRLKANKDQNPQRPNLVFYMGDGEQTVKEEPKTFAVLKDYLKGGAVLQYGTETGGKMKEFSTDPSDRDYVIDYEDTSKPFGTAAALSKADPTRLKVIAEQMGVSYVDRSQPSDITQAFGESNAERIADATKPVNFFTNLYFLFALPLTGLLIWEGLYVYKRYSELKVVAPEKKNG
jgi:Ca-activated chloride channel family protein